MCLRLPARRPTRRNWPNSAARGALDARARRRSAGSCSEASWEGPGPLGRRPGGLADRKCEGFRLRGGPGAVTDEAQFGGGQALYRDEGEGVAAPMVVGGGSAQQHGAAV